MAKFQQLTAMALAQAGFHLANVASHSLRISAATTAAAAGIYFS